MGIAVSVRLPEVLVKQLDRIAKETERPRSFLIKKALEYYFNEYADLQVALDRLRDKDDEIISSKEMRKSLGI